MVRVGRLQLHTHWCSTPASPQQACVAHGMLDTQQHTRTITQLPAVCTARRRCCRSHRVSGAKNDSGLRTPGPEPLPEPLPAPHAAAAAASGVVALRKTLLSNTDVAPLA